MSVIPRILYDKCPLCDSRDIVLEAIGDCTGHICYHESMPPKIRWMLCNRCTHVFTEGIFSEETQKLLFDKIGGMGDPDWEFERERKYCSKIVEKVARYKNSGLWMDVGCGNGALMYAADEFGFEAIGIDTRARNVQQIRDLGYEAHCGDITHCTTDKQFSVISMGDVIEHVAYPKLALQAVRRMLEPGGVLFVSTPCYNCQAWKFLNKTANPYWCEVEHYHNFSRRRLYALLNEMGFAPVHYGISERYIVGMEVIALG